MAFRGTWVVKCLVALDSDRLAESMQNYLRKLEEYDYDVVDISKPVRELERASHPDVHNLTMAFLQGPVLKCIITAKKRVNHED